MNDFAGTTYHVGRKVVVYNQYQKEDPLQWLYPLAAASVESVAVFDGKTRLVHHNDRFGTLKHAADRDLVNLQTLCEYYGKFYVNWLECFEIVGRAYLDRCPKEFMLYHKFGMHCACRVYPAIIDNGRLGGVVWMAHRDNRLGPGTNLQRRKGDREQLARTK